MTNEHVVTAHCPTNLQLCNNIKVSDLIINTDLNILQKPTYSLDAKVIALKPEVDLALLGLEISNSEIPDKFLGLPEVQHCGQSSYSFRPLDVQYNIGFPSVSHRYKSDEVSDANVLTKRWSTGLYVNWYHKVDRLFPKVSPDSIWGGQYC